MTEPTAEILALAVAVAVRYSLDPALVLGVVECESGFDPLAVGDEGHSVGLLQLHDQGAGAGMSIAERQDPARNLERGCAYLRDCLAAFGDNIFQALSAFNQGIGGVQERGWVAINAANVAKYLEAYQRWTVRCLQDAALPHLDAAFGWLSHRPLSTRRARDEIVAAKRALGLP